MLTVNAPVSLAASASAWVAAWNVTRVPLPSSPSETVQVLPVGAPGSLTETTWKSVGIATVTQPRSPALEPSAMPTEIGVATPVVTDVGAVPMPQTSVPLGDGVGESVG